MIGPRATEDAPGYPSRTYAWTVVAILIATAILSYTDRQVLSLLVDPIRHDLGISDTQVSLLLGSAFAVIYGLAGIPLGILADRRSRRQLICLGVAVWSAGTVACAMSRNFSELFCSRICVGLGEAALSPAAISLLSDYFPPARRGTAVAFFLSGIAMGSGVAIVIGGGVLRAIEAGLLAATPLAALPPWRTVLLLIGGPGLLWAGVILLIREPRRRASTQAAGKSERFEWPKVLPLYAMLAAASFVDNALGAWAPTLLIRSFSRDPAQIGLQLGLLLTAGFGGGVLVGGFLADWAARHGGFARKVTVCLCAVLLIVPASGLLASPRFAFVMGGIPLYYALSGCITAVGFSAILDVVPNQGRGFAMSMSFFLNVAIGAGLGPTAVALASTHLFEPAAGLGPSLVTCVLGGDAVSFAAVGAMLAVLRRSPAAALGKAPS